MFDPAPDEPDEWSPEERWGDPERDLPRVPKAPSTRDTTQNEVSAEVAATFWGVVFIVNIGLFAVALGPMLVYFNGQWDWGGGLFVFGVLALAHAYSRYRTFKRERDAETAETEATERTSGADGGDDADEGGDDAEARADSDGADPSADDDTEVPDESDDDASTERKR